MRRSIYFREISSQAAEFLHELDDPELLRMPHLAPDVRSQLRRAQVARIEESISLLRARQEEFNQKMEEYVANLRRLMTSLLAGARESQSSPVEAGGTRVRCPRCEREERFANLQILFARECADSFNSPTECYVSEDGEIKKGVFSCRECGGESLLIRAEPVRRVR